MALSKNIAIPRGSHVTLNFSNVPAGELPGDEVKFTVSRGPNSTVKIIGPKDCTTPNEQGVYRCTLTASDTDKTPGKYFWDTRINTEGSETLLAYGVFVITPIAQLP